MRNNIGEYYFKWHRFPESIQQKHSLIHSLSISLLGTTGIDMRWRTQGKQNNPMKRDP